MDEKMLLYICRAAVLLLLLPIHELSHAVTARALGDNTAEEQGRISINPFVHLDLLGSGLLLFAGVGWAKPVPVDTRNFKNEKQGMALTALAGPLSNLVVSFAIIVAMRFLMLSITEYSDFLFYLVVMMELVAQISVNLAIFNLLPVPPLDGSRLVAAFLPDKLLNIYYANNRIVSAAFMGILLFTDLFDSVIFAGSNFIMNAFVQMTSFIG